MSKRNIWIAALLIVLTLIVAPSMAQEPTTPAFPQDTITVRGIGTSTSQPTLATLSMGVEKFNADVKEAFSDVNTTLRAVVEAVQGVGVAADDIETSYLSIYLEQSYSNGAPEVTGYRISNQVTVTVRDISQIEAIIDAAIGAGATSLSGPNFDITDRAALETTARANAMENARAKAQEYAELMGVTLGDITVITEVPNQTFFPYAAAQADEMGRGGGGAFVSPGDIIVQVEVQVTFRIVRGA
ncbi:MAG: SIMPL domain-containing protein [Anaerolineae bacterium]|jgi:hypothetical protein|nr:SIMPL domain-containing protein [Anaerolineae bacterium]